MITIQFIATKGHFPFRKIPSIVCAFKLERIVLNSVSIVGKTALSTGRVFDIRDPLFA